jgi:hypothetical protein
VVYFSGKESSYGHMPRSPCGLFAPGYTDSFPPVAGVTLCEFVRGCPLLGAAAFGFLSQKADNMEF